MAEKIKLVFDEKKAVAAYRSLRTVCDKTDEVDVLSLLSALIVLVCEVGEVLKDAAIVPDAAEKDILRHLIIAGKRSMLDFSPYIQTTLFEED